MGGGARDRDERQRGRRGGAREDTEALSDASRDPPRHTVEPTTRHSKQSAPSVRPIGPATTPARVPGAERWASVGPHERERN